MVKKTLEEELGVKEYEEKKMRLEQSLPWQLNLFPKSLEVPPALYGEVGRITGSSSLIRRQYNCRT